MPDLTKTIAASLATGLMALLTASEATVQERITLETIGAVRMARFEAVRGVNPELRPAQGAPARRTPAGRDAAAR